MPSCLRRVGIGAGHEDAPVADPPAGAPHLLAVDDEPVAVALGPGRQRPEVAAGAGLGEQLAPHVVGVERGPQVLGLLLGRAVAQDRPAGEHQPDHVQHRRHPGSGALDAATPPGARALNPRPPCSTGQWIPAYPAAFSSRCQATPASISSGGQIAP